MYERDTSEMKRVQLDALVSGHTESNLWLFRGSRSFILTPQGKTFHDLDLHEEVLEAYAE